MNLAILLLLLVSVVVTVSEPTQLPTKSPSPGATLQPTDIDGYQRRGEKPKAAAVLFVPVAERHVSAVEVTMSSSSGGATTCAPRIHGGTAPQLEVCVQS